MKQNDIENAVADASFASFHVFQNRNSLAKKNHDEYNYKPSNADPDVDSDDAMYEPSKSDSRFVDPYILSTTDIFKILHHEGVYSMFDFGYQISTLSDRGDHLTPSK